MGDDDCARREAIIRKRYRALDIEFEAVLGSVVTNRCCSHILDLARIPISHLGASTRRCKPVRSRAASGFQQVRVLGMLFNVGLYERALRDHLQSIGPHLVERTLDQPGADAFAAELWRHFGMDECDDAVRYLVIGRGNMAFDAKFVAVMRWVVGNRVVHINQFLAVSPGVPFSDLLQTTKSRRTGLARAGA